MMKIPSGIEPVVVWLLRASGQAAVLTLLVLLVHAVCGNRLAARWRFSFWLLVVLRLLLPVSLPSAASVFNWARLSEERDGALGTITSGGGSAPRRPGRGEWFRGPPEPALALSAIPGSALSTPVVVPLRAEEVSQSHLSRGQWIALAWLAGVALLGGRVLWRNAVFCWRLRWEPTVTEAEVWEVFEECRLLMGVRCRLVLVETALVHSPALYGFLRLYLLLPPKTLATFSVSELRYVFLHELAHVKRRDMLVNWFVTVLQVAHWFNPLLWLAFRRMAADRELAADALALSHLEAKENVAYGRAILKLLKTLLMPAPLPGLVGILEDKSQMTRRISMIAKFGTTSHSPRLAIPVFAALAVVTLTDARTPDPVRLALRASVIPGLSVARARPETGAPAGPRASWDAGAAVDPETGIPFTKFKAISGRSDVIDTTGALSLSPNGKFLLANMRVVPLDGAPPFDLVSGAKASGGSWSPDGTKVAFLQQGLWLIDVNPETGRAVGAARRFLALEDRGLPKWSLDSRRILFRRVDSGVPDRIWALSIENGGLSPVADPFDFGLLSPDGTMVACSDGQGVGPDDAVLVKSVKGGEPRKLADHLYPVAWSADSQWLVCKPLIGGGWRDQVRFIRLADSREIAVNAPGVLIRRSPQDGKLYFYHMSYDYRNVLKVAPVGGGPPAALGGSSLSLRGIVGYQVWARDGRCILVDKGGDRGFWVVALDGRAPQPLTIASPLGRQADRRLAAPDASKILLMYGPDPGAESTSTGWDFWVVPISLCEMRSTGPAVKVFSGAILPSPIWSDFPDLWCPDGSKIAFVHDGDIWVASADGRTSTQLTDTVELDMWPDWSPDGTRIAYASLPAPFTNTVVRVAPASGGASRLITSIPVVCSGPRFFAWSPDGKELTIASGPDGAISNFPVLSGEPPRTVLRFEDLGLSAADWLRWSPTGRLLAFLAPDSAFGHTLEIYHPGTGKIEHCEGYQPWYWSPDDRWISYFTEDESVKTRAESVIWELDIEKALVAISSQAVTRARSRLNGGKE
ncbi:MAG: M56 family metallopeptidase [Verrucomicrobiia bacterium]